MLAPGADAKIYLCTGYTDMRKGIAGLSSLAQSCRLNQIETGALFVFRGKRADKMKILWWDGQGFCLFYKRLERGQFTWPQACDSTSLGITRAQLMMLLEGIDWRRPSWSKAPEYLG